jgi:hypothetical protein
MFINRTPDERLPAVYWEEKSVNRSLIARFSQTASGRSTGNRRLMRVKNMLKCLESLIIYYDLSLFGIWGMTWHRYCSVSLVIETPRKYPRP